MDKICPLMSMRIGWQQTDVYIGQAPEYVYCQKEKCAWWQKSEPLYDEGGLVTGNFTVAQCAIEKLARK